MSELLNCEKALDELQKKRKEKESQFIRLYDKLYIQQSQFLIQDIRDIDRDIAIIKKKIRGLKMKGGNDQ